MRLTQFLYCAASVGIMISCNSPNGGPNQPRQTDTAEVEKPQVGQPPRQADIVEIKYQPRPPRFPVSPELVGKTGIIKMEMIIDSEGIPVEINLTDCPPSLTKIIEEFGLKWRFRIHTSLPQKVFARMTVSLPYKFPK